MSDYGIAISNKDSNVNDLKDILFTSKYATAKLDTSKDISFSNILFTFLNNPPEPTPPASVTTRVMTIPHTYNYIPSFWSLINISSPVSSSFRQDYFQESGIVSAQTAFDSAVFYVDADKDNINFYVTKDINDAVFGLPNPLTGLILKIRLYVFVENVGI